jgi:trigger factor
LSYILETNTNFFGLRILKLKIETSPRDDHQVKIVAELDSETLVRFMHRAAKKIAKQTKIPGFRPGKAPFEIIVRSVGEKYVEQEALELLIDEYYPKAIAEAGVEPLYPGSIEEIISTDPPKFSFIVPLKPEVELCDYKTIRKEYEPEEVTEEEVNEVLSNFQRGYATANPAERPIEEGDLVYLTYTGKLTQPEEGDEGILMKDAPIQVVVGSDGPEAANEPYEGFSKELIGLEAEQEKTFTYSYPEDTLLKELQGKEVEFTVNIQSIKEMELPELDDEFAKSLGGNFETMEDFRKSIVEQLDSNKKSEYEQTYNLELVDSIIEQSTIKYPPQMIEEEIESVLKGVEEDIARQRMDLDTYLKLRDIEKDEFIENEIKPIASQRLERSLILDKIAEVEKVEIDNDKLKSSVAETMISLQSTPQFADYKKKGGTKAMQDLAQAVTFDTANRLLSEGILQRLKDIATGDFEKSQETLEKVKAEDVTETPAENTEESPADEA